MSADWALIFDCDGVILESESLHREAYNAVFREFEVPYEWTPAYYDVLQNKVGGGIPKMRYYFGENGWPSSTLGAPPETPEGQDALLDTLQDRKTQIYKDMIGGEAETRPNILRIMDAAIAAPNVAVSICSASTKSACMFVLESLLGEDRLNALDFVAAGDDVEKRKPDPEIYTLASKTLGVPPAKCLVVEDSLIGLQAAVGAGMKCLITHTSSTADQDFSRAVAVYPELPGDLDLPALEGLVGSSAATAQFAYDSPITSPRRALAGVALATAIALGGDLFGVTQAVLSAAPEVARSVRADLVYPVAGFKRFMAADGSYELLYPKTWLADQATRLPKAGSVRSLDQGGTLIPRKVEAKRNGPQLDAAFGPPAGGRLENLSVLRTNLGQGVDLDALLGTPAEAAQRLLDSSIAPANSGKMATLNSAEKRADGVVQFDYTVRFAEGSPMAGRVIKNQACVAYNPATGDLFTLTVLAPEEEWASGASGSALRAMAPSFKLIRAAGQSA